MQRKFKSLLHLKSESEGRMLSVNYFSASYKNNNTNSIKSERQDRISGARMLKILWYRINLEKFGQEK